ncbi:hypothetical protein [Hyphomicrobium sp. CS1GBMeth3]|uniref:hypothetical protein n=1 Tax=Hyphomicrobium sp. CS1GBMeth3 TaxID=1892845 RepID=UPI000A823438|nr:hypothetical protein [Hyphomicrobium sp. CS1GBMeth3]
MKTKFTPSVAIGAILVSSTWSYPAAAGPLGDIICGIFSCGGGGTGGGTAGAPEIDGGAGLAAMALVAGIAAIIYRKIRN